MISVALTDEITVGEGRPLLVIAGPCAIEDRSLCVDVAGAMAEACAELGLPYVFKASFDKANRTSIESFRGPGLEDGLEVLTAVRQAIGVPVLTDIHEPAQAQPVAQAVDVLQVPAFLCRQTDLLVAAARTGRPVNIKKGQFMAPGDMAASAGKLQASGCNRILLTERGTTFGYHNLVVDMRGIPEMKQAGYPVIFDVTHSVQRPAAQGTCSGGDRELAPALARAAVAAGANGVFIETHPDPENALCDASTMLPTTEVPPLLERLKAIAEAAREDA
jgi:2-dehydro-3-deoxyphosphooctonate aldolase (KDO 8-P synthase)